MEKIEPKIFIVGGLLYCDEGKGTIVEFLAKEYESNLVVRYGGGPQAAHHIVLPNGIWHCFNHFGSGSFFENCKTLLSKYIFIYPQTLVNEALKNIIDKLYIDKECFIITPYHQIINRICETLRGNKSHESTGLGVGQATDEAYYLHPECFALGEVLFDLDRENNLQNTTCLRIKDLNDSNVLLDKLKKMHQEKLDRIRSIIKSPQSILGGNIEIDELAVKEAEQLFFKFVYDYTVNNLYNFYTEFNRNYKDCFTNGLDILEEELQKGKNIIFEGSQGSLLDRVHGIFPHITKSLCSDHNAMKLLSEVKTAHKIIKIGVLRVYSSRHGNGPFVTYNPEWNKYITEEHNQNTKWQGKFKLGPFDLIAAKYGIEIFKPDYLALTYIDKLQDGYKDVGLDICRSYVIEKPCDEIIPLINSLFEVDEEEWFKIKNKN
jgi:adenylosuccinate synthase